MINIILFLFFIACVSLPASLIVENPGEVTMVWMGYQIETSVAFIIFSLVALAILLIIITLILRSISAVPSQISNKRKVGHLKSGINELTYSIAALASSNIDAAEKHLVKVEKLIGKTPLTLLLSAQISKNRGDETKTQILLEQLLEHKETEYLAARSLSENASKNDNLPKALQLAKKAQSMHPRDANSAVAVISLQVRMKNYSEALAILQASTLPRREKKRIKALILLTHGQILLSQDRYEEALSLAKTVIHIIPDFSNAIAFTALAYYKNNMSQKAIRILTRAWKKNQSPILVSTLLEIISNEPNDQQQKIRAKFSGEPQTGMWNCKNCNHNQTAWSLICDSCNSFDKIEWKIY